MEINCEGHCQDANCAQETLPSENGHPPLVSCNVVLCCVLAFENSVDRV